MSYNISIVVGRTEIFFKMFYHVALCIIYCILRKVIPTSHDLKYRLAQKIEYFS